MRRIFNEQVSFILTAFHLLKDKIKIIIIFEEINNAQNIFTTTTMVIDIDFFEYTRSIRMARFANDLYRNKQRRQSVSSSNMIESIARNGCCFFCFFSHMSPSSLCPGSLVLSMRNTFFDRSATSRGKRERERTYSHESMQQRKAFQSNQHTLTAYSCFVNRSRHVLTTLIKCQKKNK